MISTECLWRITAQSLYGLVSFLCTRYPALTPDLAMQRLLVARYGATCELPIPTFLILSLLLATVCRIT